MARESPADRYFLDEVASSDPFFRAPMRRSCLVEPLVDRAPALAAIERAIAAARRSVMLAGWVFLPATPLLDAGVGKLTRGRTWLDLVEFVLTQAEPVNVRLIVTDFDPLFEAGNHRLCWSALSEFARLRARLPADRRANFEFIGSLHGFFLTPSFLTLGFLSLTEQIKVLVAEYNKAKFVTALARYRRTPGHWSSIDVDEGKRRFAMSGTPETRVFLASHHQKTCVVDGEVAFCGGMDITPLALDNPTHATRRHPFRKGENDLSWHDLHARLEGDVVIDLERNFRERWNLELLAFSARIGGFAAVMPAKGELPFSALTPIRDPGRRTGRTPGTDAAQVLRTISADKAGQFVPEIKREDIFEAYARAIGGAEQYVYLENQYFRSTPLTDAIIARHAEAPRLQVILVIPVAPEELTDLAAADPKALHPVAVQIKELKRLQAALGPNFGVFSLVLPQRARRRKFTDVAGSPQLYVHSKICIVDDEFATIGSANANGRSFAMDTELNVGWFQRSHVKRFRIDLWRHLLGRAAADVDTWPATAFTATWRAIATTNLLAPPAARSGFVVPHDFAALDAVAKEMPLVPPTFIDIADILPESASPDLVSADESRDELAAAPLS